MKKIISLDAFAIGLAMFSMFFGAGNVIFPLAVGQYSGDKNFYAIWGLILTAAIMPIIGVIAMILFDGNYKKFFGKLGKEPGFILALIIISLLGPLGSTPRCIALSYATLKTSFFEISPLLFSAGSCAIVFLFTVKKNHILTLLGWVLTPILLSSLIAIILIGLWVPAQITPVDQTKLHVFLHGLKEGYNTMDLLAAFFFSSTILNILRVQYAQHDDSSKTIVRIALKASAVGAILLAAIYMGFSYLASFHGADLLSISQDELLAAIILKIAGSEAGLLVCLTIALACLTTAIALLSAFTDFFQKEVFQGKISYEMTLLGATLMTFFVSTFEFTGISAFLGPILQICYPGLILLTFLNIMNHWKPAVPVQVPVLATFAASTVLYFVN